MHRVCVDYFPPVGESAGLAGAIDVDPVLRFGGNDGSTNNAVAAVATSLSRGMGPGRAGGDWRRRIVLMMGVCKQWFPQAQSRRARMSSRVIGNTISNCVHSHAVRPASIEFAMPVPELLWFPLVRGVILRAAQCVIAPFLGVALAMSAHATPQRAAGYYEDALKRFERADTPGAIIQLKNAIQQDNKMLAAHLLLGKALFRAGELKGAEAAFEEAMKQGISRGEVALPMGRVYLALGQPNMVVDRIPASGLPPSLQVEVLSMRGTAYAEMGNVRMATQSFFEARVIDPKSPVPLIAEVPVLLASGQADKARAAAATALQLAPENAYAWNMQASVLHAALDMPRALAAYDRALTIEPKHVDARIARAALLIDLKRTPDAVKDLDLLAAVAPEEPRAAYLRAVVAGQKGDTAAVAAALKEVVGVLDSMPPPWLAAREQLMMAAALAHHGLGSLEKSREYLEIIIGRNTRNIGARKLLGSIHVATKDFTRATSVLESLQRLVPDDPQVLFLLGQVQLAQRRYLQASELFERAVARTGAAEMNRELGFSQLGLGRDDLGRANIEKAFASNPGDTLAGISLSLLYSRLGQTQKAIQIADAMAKRDPANLTALNFLGSVKAASGDKAGARAAYSQVLAREAAFRPASLNLARLDVNEGRIDDARKRLTQMLVKNSNDIDAIVDLGALEQRAGRPAEAMRHFKKADESQRKNSRPGIALVNLQISQQLAAEALATAKELVSKYPDSLQVQLALGRAYIAIGDMPAARSVLQGTTRLADYDPVTQTTIGRLQLAAGNADGAYYNVQKALQGQPDDPGALALLVEVEAKRGQAAKADAALKVLVAKHPNRVETALTGAHLAMSRGQYAVAVTGFRTALSREETTATALHLVRAHLAAGEAAKAATFLQGWVARRPTDMTALKSLAEAQFRAGQLAAARQTYAQVVTAQPNDAAMLNNYANLLHQLKDPEARVQAEKALKLVPNSGPLADTLGWILVQQGEIEAGLRYLREARLRTPESGEIRFHLAYALSKTGRSAEAKEELGAALNGPRRVAVSDEVTQLRRDLGL